MTCFDSYEVVKQSKRDYPFLSRCEDIVEKGPIINTNEKANLGMGDQANPD